MSRQARATYDGLSIVLHWAIAVLVLTALLLAWRFEGLEGAARGAPIRLHKSIGVTVLVLSLVRPAWRACHPVTPTAGAEIERRLAKAVHLGLYGLLVLMPLSGWAMISADSAGRPTRVWGLVPWPRLRLLADLPAPLHEQVHGVLGAIHLAIALTLVALIALHVAAAVKRHRAGPQGMRMVPWLRRSPDV